MPACPKCGSFTGQRKYDRETGLCLKTARCEERRQELLRMERAKSA